MPRPQIRVWAGELFRKQLNFVLDWLEDNGGTGGSLLGLGLTVAPTAPASPQENDIWIEATGSTPTNISVAIGATAPPSPAVGQAWLDIN